jgi:hypothetical protein
MKRTWMLATALTFAWAHPALPQEEPPIQEEPQKEKS